MTALASGDPGYRAQDESLSNGYSIPTPVSPGSGSKGLPLSRPSQDVAQRPLSPLIGAPLGRFQYQAMAASGQPAGS